MKDPKSHQSLMTGLRILQLLARMALRFASISLALISVVLFFFNAYLALNSTDYLESPFNDIGKIAILFISFVASLLIYVNRRIGIQYTGADNRQHKIDNLFILYGNLAIIGFIQTFFWVIDTPDGNIHEPRTVFILTTTGFFGYLSSLSRKYLASEEE
jgi:hypothetical protein